MDIMNQFTETTHFLREFMQHMHEVGALLPTSTYAADTLAAECARHLGPKRVLEVGAGTGAITVRIARLLKPGDHLVVCEINPTFVTMLEQRFANDPLLRALLPQIEFYTGSVLDLLPTGAAPRTPTATNTTATTQDNHAQKFDYIISAIPFNNCAPAFVDQVFSHYRTLLKPGGVLSYIEYVGGRTRKRIDQTDPLLAARVAVFKRYLGHFEYRRDVVVRNLPPAWIHFLRFGASSVEEALARQAEPQSHQVVLPSLAIDTDAVPFIAGAAALGWLLRKVAPKTRLWWLSVPVVALLTFFFRDPKRTVVADPAVVYAASDGVVLTVEELTDERFGDQPWLRVAVFLSILDPHVNRSPLAGTVVEVVTTEGTFVDARDADAEHNQAVYTVIEGSQGRCIVAQRAGLIAQRIVNRCRPGQPLAQGEKFGLIRFSSRTDVYLPAGQAEATVKVGDRVIAGVTPLLRYRSRGRYETR